MNDIPSNMIQYSRFSEGIFYIKAHLATPDSQDISAEVSPFEVNICEKGYKDSSTYGTCNSCSSTGWYWWQVVTSSYQDLCRTCNPNVTSCIQSTVCPLDYYSEDGICKKCPVGWSEWSDMNTCTYWDNGLSLVTLSNGTVACDCPTGYFNTSDIATDTMTWTAWTHPWGHWDLISTNWTSCSENYYLESNTCLSDCGINKFENTVDNTWGLWSTSWEQWTNSTVWTQWESGKVIQEGGCVDSWSDNYLLFGSDWSMCTLGCSRWDTITTNCTRCFSGYYLDSKSIFKVIII